MRRRSTVSGGILVFLMIMLVLAGCAKKIPPTAEAPSTEAMSAAEEARKREEAARLERERMAAIEERERAAREESMRRQRDEESRRAQAMAMAREQFVNQDVHFAFDSFTLNEEAKSILGQKASWLASNAQTTTQIEGHADERGTTAYNLALGERRANAVKQYLTALGVQASRLTTISYGEEAPLDPGHNEQAWARNRRAHFVITGQ